jgi:hypothetical protein
MSIGFCMRQRGFWCLGRGQIGRLRLGSRMPIGPIIRCSWADRIPCLTFLNSTILVGEAALEFGDRDYLRPILIVPSPQVLASIGGAINCVPYFWATQKIFVLVFFSVGFTKIPAT